MNHDYSLEEEKNRISNQKTKEYFDEVYSSYQLGNYRSSIVMLWSVIVCDVIYKIQELESVYNDQNAKSLLDDFSKQYENKSKSSEWELLLLENVFKKTLLIDFGTMETIKHIQKYRHISAHPVLETGYDLYIPNKDLCRGLIISALIGLLTKPAFFTKKVFDEFLKDISENKEILISKEQIKTYIDAKYMKHLLKPIQLEFIKALWKLVFKLDNDDCANNRNINRRVLEVLTKSCLNELITELNKDNKYYSINISVDKSIKACSIYHYFNTFPELFFLLREDAQTLVKGVQNNNVLTLLLSRFLFTDWQTYEEHILEKMKDPISIKQLDSANDSDIKTLLNFHKENMQEKIMYKMFILIYSKCSDFNDGDIKFQKYIAPFINEMEIEELVNIMEITKENNQSYARGQASIDHKLIKDRIKILNSAFDFSKYSQFLMHVEV